MDAPVIGFAGTPHRHKGFDILLEGAVQSKLPFHLLLCGDAKHALFERAAECFGDRCHFTGMLPNEEMPYFLAASDVIPILQKRIRYSESQMPAKILEAMSMGKWIIGTSVGDIPLLLGEAGEKRGWLVEPEDVNSFTSALIDIYNTPLQKRADISAAARSYFLENASVSANIRKLREILTYEKLL